MKTKLERMDASGDPERRKNKSSRAAFSQIHATKLGTLCAIFYCCETDMKKNSIHLKV